MAAGAEEREDGLGDVDVAEEVGLEHVVDECLANILLGIDFEES